MNLPFLNKKKEETGFYLALLLTDEKASAVILHEEAGKVKIIGNHEEKFSRPLEHVSLEELIEIVDKALSHAEEVLPPSIETHNTVFGVKESWVEEESKKIKKQHLSQLKKVCDSLDLTPIGFMVTSEAVTHLLQEEEGAPLSAILAEVTKSGVTLSLLRGGKKLETVNDQFKEYTPVVTVDMLLRHFTVPVLPARLILYDYEARENLPQQFISHQWSKSLPFLHPPQITVIPPGFDARAVAFGAASQMGFELVGIEKDHVTTLTPQTPHGHHQHEEKHEEPHEDIPEATHEEAPTHEDKPVEGDNFGFVTGQDIAEVAPGLDEKQPLPHHTKQDMHHEKPEHTPLHHAAHTEPVHEIHHPVHQTHPAETDEEEAYEDDEDEPRGKHNKAAPLAFLSGLKLPAFGGGFDRMSKNKKIVIPVIAVAVLILGIAAFSFYYLYQTEATVELTMKPNMVNQTTKAVFSTTNSSNYEKNIIAAKNITATVDGEVSIDTSGKKDVGEKAKGTVTIFNNDSDKVTLKSGTEIKSSNNLVFLLEKDVNVGSASGDIFSGTKPGTADVAVVAKEIGSDQNLPSNTKFAIGSNSSLAAKNDGAFSGGSKKSVNVVSKEDHAKLRAELPKSLQSKAKDAIAQKAGNNETVLPYFATNSLEKATYDKKIDEEAKKVKLKASVVFDGMAYENEELVKYAEEVLKKEKNEDISFANKSVKPVVKDAKQKGEKEMEATVIIEGGVLPKINTDEVAQGLQGKSFGEAQEILAGLPDIAQSDIKFSLGIPFLPQLFPSLPKHITVITKAE